MRQPPFPYAAAVTAVAVAVTTLVWHSEIALKDSLGSEQRTVAQLNARVASLERGERAQTDWPSIAASVEQSVVTIEAGDFGGSGWVAYASASGSEIITNFHVVAGAWAAGNATVQVRRQDQTIDGTVVRVDARDDVAVIHVNERLQALASAVARPALGSTVMAVGSPLGLDGTVTLGIVSGFRSLEGSDYMQFSAPISPGNSGGPVIDSHGRVVAIASAKLVGQGVEGLSLAIPVETVCPSLVTCKLSGS